MDIDQAAKTTKILVHVLYGFWLMNYAVIFVARPVLGTGPVGIPPGLFYGVFLGLAVALTAAAFLTGGRILDKVAAGETTGTIAERLARARRGAILMGALGEAGAILGLTHYLATADLPKLAIFAALAGTSYAFTVAKVSAAFDRLRGSV